ncbi:MAG TPA: hypothetical protein VGH34_08520 [Vicinamibacterales bacterium]|jgi:hypothetical protein
MNRRRRRDAMLLGAGLVFGLVLRWQMLDGRGGVDMADYLRWGNAVLDQGLARGYVGIHFPLQYQVYEFCSWFARSFAIDPYVVFKAANIPFDLGTYVILIALLRRAGVSPLYALVYWLHPWFLVVFALGYIDMQMTFCVVLSLWLLKDASTRARSALAGVPFAAAVMLKPQMSLPFAALAFYAFLRWKQTGNRDVACFLIPVAVAGLSYETYFTTALWRDIGARALVVFPTSIARIGSTMPVLTANMLNVWYPLAAWLKEPGAQIWTVSSKLLVLPHLQVRFVAFAVTVGIIAWYVTVVTRSRRQLTLADRLRYILTFTTFIVPSIMTSAHENHLFAATALFVLLLGTATVRTRAAIHIVLASQMVNLEGIYGFDSFGLWLQPMYSVAIRTALALVSIGCFAVIGAELYRLVSADPIGRAAILEGSGG